jgi:hypothetical protein
MATLEETLKKLGLSAARGVPQLATGVVDLFALPFTMTGVMKPEQAVGSTAYLTSKGLLPPPQEGLLSETTELVSSAMNPATATKAALAKGGLLVAPMLSVGKKTATEVLPEMAQSYRGSHTAPNAAKYGATLDNLGGIMPENVYSSKGIGLYGLGDRAIDSQWFAAAYKAKGKPDAEVTVYRAVPKGVKDINSGDWVTTSKNYAQNHGESALNGEYEIISKKVKAKTLSSEGYPYEFGYNE